VTLVITLSQLANLCREIDRVKY